MYLCNFSIFNAFARARGRAAFKPLQPFSTARYSSNVFAVFLPIIKRGKRLYFTVLIFPLRNKKSAEEQCLCRFCLRPYENGKIVNMDVATSEKTKFVVMSFDEGTGLSEHAAPGDALIFALDGKGIIGYEGKEYSISAGENFRFAKGGKHYVKADGKFKMALLLTLE